MAKDKNNSRERRSLEFGGPLGTTCMVVGLPIAVWFLNIGCGKVSCTVLQLPEIPTWNEFFCLEAFLLFIVWFGLQLILSILPTGTVAKGLPLKSGKCLDYRCNGFTAMVITIIMFAILVLLGFPVTYVYEKFLALATSSIIFSMVLSIFLYLRSLTVPKEQLAQGGNSGIFIYDFFIGRELNPRIGPVDLKFFCELRPGLIGWVMLDLCFVVQACKLYGQPSLPLLLVVAFHTLYVADALWHEEAILTTMDIVHDGFGCMLAFGDLTWVPFVYCLQARFLLEHPQPWTYAGTLAVFLLNVVGFYIFRASNSQKDKFRQNPTGKSVSSLTTLTTSSGKQLLISGWWGLSRHPNYMGDIIMAFSWSLYTGFQHILPYFYSFFLLGLLIHRSLRDDHNCRHKYGTDWDKYCKIVPYRIFPYVY